MRCVPLEPMESGRAVTIEMVHIAEWQRRHEFSKQGIDAEDLGRLLVATKALRYLLEL